jgi:hypothetical protein
VDLSRNESLVIPMDIKYYQQTFDMVRNRIKLHLQQGSYSGNPMTAKEGIQYMHNTKKFVVDNTSYHKLFSLLKNDTSP